MGRKEAMKLEEVFAGVLFISDLGETQTVQNNGEEISIGQYAVWAPISGTTRHQIVEVSDNLDYLMEKYNISKDNICRLA